MQTNQDNKQRVAIIGGGAAGMFSAILLAEKGIAVDLYEKNEKLGKKLFITGKGRCNLTNNTDVEALLSHVVSNKKFLYSAFYNFTAQDTMAFFEKLGLAIKTERGNRVFPVSDHSSDVISVLTTKMNRLGVLVYLEHEVSQLTKQEDETFAIKVCNLKDGKKEKTISYEKVIVATGGVSYPRTGSTGDGLRWAEDFGLNIIPTRPALVPLCIEDACCKQMMGLSLKNVEASFVATVKGKDKVIYKEFGEMIFTHFGVSGPIILSGSSYIGKYENSNLRLVIDLKPALSESMLDERILRDFEAAKNKQFRNSLNDLLPKRLIEVIIEKSEIDPYKKVNEISREERLRIVNLLKHFTLNVSGTRSFDEAIITQGGLSVKEVNPGTMEVKNIPGLYYIGEVLDLDALTGGFNLQIAWSTAALLADAF